MQTSLHPTRDSFSKFSRSAAMSLPALRRLKKMLTVPKRYPRILEIGSGLSTLVLNEYKRIYPDCYIVSVDTSGPWNDALKKCLKEEGDSGLVLLTRELSKNHKFYLWEDSDLRDLQGPFDLVIIDGPWDPGSRICDAARELYSRVVGPETSFVIDDSQRGTENKLVQHCKSLVGAWKLTEEHIFDSFKGQEYRRTTFLRNGLLNADPTTVSIGITSWLRFPERFDLLRRTLEALRERLKISRGRVLEVVISAEVDEVSEDLKTNLAAYCNAYGYRLCWREGNPKANLAQNLNNLFTQCEGDYILCVEDDWELQETLDLGESVGFLEDYKSYNYHVVRFKRSNPEGVNELVAIDGTQYKQLLPEGTTNFLTYNPHLRSKTVFEMTGPHYSREGTFETGGEGITNKKGKELVS